MAYVFTEKERTNWLKAWLAVDIAKSGLEQFAENEAKTVHINIYKNVLSSVPAPAVCNLCNTANLLRCPTRRACNKRSARSACTAMHDTAAKQPRPCPDNVCNKVLNEIEKQHTYAIPSWKNTTATLWASTPWQIAKAYYPDGYSGKSSIQDTDFNGIISFMMNCKHFNTKFSFPIAAGKNSPPCLLTKARDIGRIVRHSSQCKLTDADLQEILTTLTNLLSDPTCLAQDVAAQDAVKKLAKLQNNGLKITTQEMINAVDEELKEVGTIAEKTLAEIHTDKCKRELDEHTERRKLATQLITVVENLADKTLDQLPKYLEQCMVDLNVHMDKHFSKTVESSDEQSCKGPGIEALGSYCDESKHMSFNVLLVMKHSATEEYWKFLIKVFDDKYKCDGDIFDTNLDSFVAYIPAKAPDTPDDLNVSGTKNNLNAFVSNDEVHVVLNDPGNNTDVQDLNDATISVGSAHQASLPEGLCMYGDVPAYENEDRLLWDPSRMNDSEVEKYLEEIHLQCRMTAIGVHAVPTVAHVHDDEQALYLLLQCGHNKEEALRRRKMQAIPATDPMSLWSEEECSNFKTGLRFYGKDFYMIHQNKVKTRSVGELVQFYYLWKKTERHDIFANKTRLDKQRYTLYPGVTDYMERFLDEQESSAPSIPNRDRSANPVHSLLYWDPKRNHIKPPTHPDPGAWGDSEKGSAFQPIYPGVDFNTSTTTIPCILPETPTHKAAEVENIGAKNGLLEDSYIPALKKLRLDHSVAEHGVCELDKTNLSLKTNSTEAHINHIDPIKMPS